MTVGPAGDEMEREIHVLVVTHSEKVWGAERQLLDLRPRLLAARIRITLACPAGSELSRAWAATGSATVPYQPAGPLGLREPDGSRSGIRSVARQLFVIAADARRVRKLVRDAGADVVESYTLNANAEVVLAGRLTRTPAVVDLHDIVVPGIGRRVLGLTVSGAQATIANSRATAGATHRGRVEIVHPGVDVTRFRPGPAEPGMRERLAARADRPIVGILGRLDPEKGIDVLARAMARLRAPHDDAQLAVVGAPLGDGAAYAESLRREASALLGDRVRFVGPTDDVPAVVRALDVLVNASRAEPFGLTVLEALACGVPVVASAAGGIPEFVTDGVSGLLFPPGDEDALAGALARMLDDSTLRQRAREQGRSIAEQKSIDHQAARVAEVLRSVLAPDN